MKTTYIYLNHYFSKSGKEYLYVGSHTWDGPLGELDLTYTGSSSVAKHFGWVPHRIEILDSFISSKEILHKESEYIKDYLNRFGVADCALSVSSNKFVKSFKPHGLMLNLHANSMEQAYPSGLEKCKLPEVRAIANKKAYQTQLSNGHVARMHELANSESAKLKMVSTRINNGGFQKTSEEMDRINTTKANKKLADPFYGKHKWVDVYKDEVLVSSGRLTTCCRELGHRNWQSGITKHFSKGVKEVLYRGYLFVLKNNED